MSKAKSTVAAAAAANNRDTTRKPVPLPAQTQGALSDRHVRNHTPDSLYGGESETDDQQ